jgi:CRP-like cAMP-binding protein|tara:strand:+ start:141169 stop:141471 length:303 start_codon:yes stop_codon:yes gene_type:complete
MRKIILVLIFSIGMISTYAVPTINAEANFTSQQELQKYAEVKVSELPQHVKDAVAKDFEGATINKAYKSEKGEFKLVISTADGESQTLHANSKGEWIEKQ